MPKTVGLHLQQAKSRLWELGLNIGKISFDEGINLLNQREEMCIRDSCEIDNHIVTYHLHIVGFQILDEHLYIVAAPCFVSVSYTHLSPNRRPTAAARASGLRTFAGGSK